MSKAEQEMVYSRLISAQKSTVQRDSQAVSSSLLLFVYAYCKNGDLVQYISQGCPNANNRTLFPYLNTPSLTPEEWEALEVTLKSQTEDIKKGVVCWLEKPSRWFLCYKQCYFHGNDFLQRKTKHTYLVPILFQKCSWQFASSQLQNHKDYCQQIQLWWVKSSYGKYLKCSPCEASFEIPSYVFMPGQQTKMNN